MNETLLKQFLYNSGDAFLPEKIKQLLSTDLIGSSKKTFYVSGWSIVHFMNGIIIGYLYLYFNWDRRLYMFKLFIIHIFWELWETILGMSKPYNLTGRGNIIDMIIDTLFFMLGAYILRSYYKQSM